TWGARIAGSGDDVSDSPESSQQTCGAQRALSWHGSFALDREHTARKEAGNCPKQGSEHSPDSRAREALRRPGMRGNGCRGEQVNPGPINPVYSDPTVQGT